MKFTKQKYSVLLFAFTFVLLVSCDDEIMDNINENKNSPTEASISLFLPQATMSTIHGVAGDGAGEYASFFVEHATNVHLNDREPFNINSTVWSRVYSTLNDLDYIIKRGADGGIEEGHYVEVGIAKILYAYTLSIGTDLFGEIPHSEALEGSENRSPGFDSQQEIYTFLQNYLDEAITDLDRGTLGNPSNTDLIFGGNTEMWKKTAYALKARLYNRLSNINPQLSAEDALNALDNAFASEDENLIFDGYLSGTTNDNPWAGWQKTEQTYAISETILEVMNDFTVSGFRDPRAELWFTQIGDEYIGAPPRQAETDLTHSMYSAPSEENVLYDEAPQPMLTYDEMKFIEAEAQLRLGNRFEANKAYEEAVRVACRRAGVSEEDINAYISQGEVFPGANNLELNHIIRQKYISFWMFQSIEAYNDVRRTGIIEMNAPQGLPLRLAYPPSEVNRNPNTPSEIDDNTIYEIPVWWAES
ncbi:Starch-binding associating with outer membrane [Fodinibius roseus]|uniref:Starch-binding associating with outer membrane n=1 Tax=Fodinibius roseus TaxID=1194090 RepID=A0A1M5GSL8_9BACT|nr:SusD/RagB family nutrient-binding outer membrane lipoprotein [Fodinibius roseus]SHG06790.1 Starch-binding associating with outer membrane [Fodinibius roseus]